jgi:hypothetical protein
MNTSILSRDILIDKILPKVRPLCNKCDQSQILDIILDNSIALSLEEYTDIINFISKELKPCQKCSENDRTTRKTTVKRKPTKRKSGK